MSVFWFLGAAAAVCLIARRHHRNALREQQQREAFRDAQAQLHRQLHPATVTLWPDSNGDRWPPEEAQSAYVAAGIRHAERFANDG